MNRSSKQYRKKNKALLKNYLINTFKMLAEGQGDTSCKVQGGKELPVSDSISPSFLFEDSGNSLSLSIDKQVELPANSQVK